MKSFCFGGFGCGKVCVFMAILDHLEFWGFRVMVLNAEVFDFVFLF